MLQIILSRPLQLHGNLRRLRNLHGFADEIGAAAASETAAKIYRMDLNFFRGKTRTPLPQSARATL